MAVVYNVILRNSRLQQVLNAIDGGAGNGLLSIGTTGMGLVLATITLQKPSATIALGVLSFAGLPLTNTVAFGGVAANAVITDSTGFVWVSGLTVGLGGTDIIITQTNLTAGGNITFLAGTITGN